MPIVFIHGVSTREGAAYESGKAEREGFFRSFLLPAFKQSPPNVDVSFPYWGGFGAKMAWNGACLPSGNYQALGMDTSETDLLLGEHLRGDEVEADRVLLDLARSSSLESAVDLLFMAELDVADDNQRNLLMTGAVQAAVYASNNPRPTWLDEVDDDESMILRLAEAISESADGNVWEAQGGSGLGDMLGDAAGWVKQKIEAKTSSALVKAARAGAQAKATNFVGDIFVYLATRGTPQIPGAIINAVGGAISAAAANRTDDDPLVVIAHSLGGEIAYDFLSAFRPDLPCDYLITVGSQVSLFEELKLLAFRNGAPNPGQPKAPKPSSVARWINVFDLNDVLGFAAGGVFEGVEDLVYDTGEGSRAAHSAYFRRPSFYNRLANKLREV